MLKLKCIGGGHEHSQIWSYLQFLVLQDWRDAPITVKFVMKEHAPGSLTCAIFITIGNGKYSITSQIWDPLSRRHESALIYHHIICLLSHAKFPVNPWIGMATRKPQNIPISITCIFWPLKGEITINKSCHTTCFRAKGVLFRVMLYNMRLLCLAVTKDMHLNIETMKYCQKL